MKSDQNEYRESVLSKKILINTKNKLAFLDIDGTLTGDFKDVNKVRKNLEQKGYGVILVTARTEEMLMSEKQFKFSQDLGFKRPVANLNKKEPKGILDPDIIIGSSGTAILIKQKMGGYIFDREYKKRIQQNKNWRKNTLNLLKKIDPEKKYYFLPKIEDPKNYYKKTANILTPKYRIQVNFKDCSFKEYIYKKLQEIEKKFNLNLSDDSDERFNKYSIYLTPLGITKGRAVNFVIERLCQTFKIERKMMALLFAGDALADLDMGFLEKDGANSTLLIVGGSRLKKQQILNFVSKIPGIPPTQLIIGDKTFPGTIGPQTILSYIQNSSL